MNSKYFHDRRNLIASAFSGGAITFFPSLVNASSWPNERVNVVVPFPAGAATDITGRVICAKLSQIWGQPVTIDNRGGGNGIPASEVVARAKPDGYSLLLTSAMTHAVNPAIYPKLSYRPVEDFEPISQLGTLYLSSWFVLTRH